MGESLFGGYGLWFDSGVLLSVGRLGCGIVGLMWIGFLWIVLFGVCMV